MKNRNFLLAIIAIILAGIFIILVLVPRPEPEIVFVPTTPLSETQETQEENPPSTPAPIPTPTPFPTPIPPQNDECALITGYSCDAYKNGWISAFKAENNLSDAQFASYVAINSTDFRPVGNNYEYSVDYTVTKSWLVVHREDTMMLKNNVSSASFIAPSDLPLEHDSATSGRLGVSTVNVNDLLAFLTSQNALDYYVNYYGLSGTNPDIQKYDFQYFWDKEQTEKGGYPFAGEGGEAYIHIRGTINSAQNKCYSGQLALVSKEMTYEEGVCWMN